MSYLTTEELIQIIQRNQKIGHQISARHGIMNSTKCIYMRRNAVYLFDISDDFIFKKQFGYSIEEFMTEYGKRIWVYEDAIS